MKHKKKKYKKYFVVCCKKLREIMASGKSKEEKLASKIYLTEFLPVDIVCLDIISLSIKMVSMIKGIITRSSKSQTQS